MSLIPPGARAAPRDAPTRARAPRGHAKRHRARKQRAARGRRTSLRLAAAPPLAAGLGLPLETLGRLRRGRAAVPALQRAPCRAGRHDSAHCSRCGQFTNAGDFVVARSKKNVSVRVRGESALERRPTGRVWDVSCPRGATAAPHSRREASDAWGGEGAVSCPDSWVGRGESRRAAGRNLANGCAAEGVWVDAGWVGRAARRTSAAGAARRAVRVTRQPFSSAEYGRRPVVHIRLSCRRAAMRAACLRRAAPLARQHQAAPCGARVRRPASAAAARGAALPHGLELLHGATLEGAKLRV